MIIGTFFSLWLVQVGLEQGKTTSESLALAGPMFGGIQLVALIWAPVMGFIADRLNRVAAVSLGLAFAAVGYTWMGLVENPFSYEIVAPAILLGIGEISVIVSVGALLGQEARGQYRGSIVGVFGQLGGLGILVSSLAGGYVFDEIGRTAPFIMMGILNAALMGLALLVYFGRHREASATDSATEKAPDEVQATG